MSPAKQAANAANAQLSTGPKTAEGKFRSSQNALKHGLTSAQIVIAPGLEQEFDDLRETLLNQMNPTEGIEMFTFNMLLHAAWNIERCRQIEATLDDPFGPEADRIARYAARAERSYYRAIKELRQLQSERLYRTETLTPEQNEAIPVLVQVSKLPKQTPAMAAVDNLIKTLAMENKIEE